MRLNRERDRRLTGSQKSPEIERVENLLRDAADYEPAIQPVDDYIARALRGPAPPTSTHPADAVRDHTDPEAQR